MATQRGCTGVPGIVVAVRQIFLADTHVNVDPTAEQLAEIAVLAAEQVRRFGIEPKVALVSHSNFGDSNAESAQKMRKALEILRRDVPSLLVDGEMHGDIAIDCSLREERFDFAFEGDANVLLLPNLDAANISYNLLKAAAGNNVAIGPQHAKVSSIVTRENAQRHEGRGYRSVDH